MNKSISAVCSLDGAVVRGPSESASKPTESSGANAEAQVAVADRVSTDVAATSEAVAGVGVLDGQTE